MAQDVLNPVEEMVAATDNDVTNPIPLATNTDIARPAAEVGSTVTRADQEVREAQKAVEQNKLADITVRMPDTVGKSFTSGFNWGYQVYKQIDRAIDSGPVDPEWKTTNNEEWLKLNSQNIAPEQAWRYRQTRNQVEAETMLSDAALARQKMEVLSNRWGVSTFIGAMAAGIVDIDAPLTILAGGLSTGAKAGFLATRSGQFLAGASVGAITMGAGGSVGYLADPNADWTTIPMAALGGAAIGGLAGVAGAMLRGNRDATLNELGEQLAMGHPRSQERWHDPVVADMDSPLAKDYSKPAPEEAATAATGDSTKPKAFDVDDAEVPLTFEPDQGMGSIGARQLNSQGPGLGSIQDPRIREVINDAQVYNRRTGVASDWMDGFYNSKIAAVPGLAKAAEVMQQAITKLGVGSDFSRMMTSNSAVAQMLAHDLLESPGGIIRNNSNAARIARQYEKDLGANYIELEDQFKAFAKENNAGIVETNWNTDLRDRFNREVFSEMQARRWDGPNAGRTTDDAVKRAADSLDVLFAKEVEIMKGRTGEIAQHGADNMTPTRGYIYQKWSGRNIGKMIGDGVPRSKIVDALAEGYMNMAPNMLRSDAVIYARATANRAEKNDIGLNTSMHSLLQQDGRLELAETLRRQGGMSEQQIEKFIERMTGLVEERGKAGNLKSRVDIDARFTASNGIKIMDLLDTDLGTTLPQRIRRVSGQAALARKGITSKAKWEELKEAVLLEQRARGESKIDPQGNPLQKADDYLNSDTQLNGEFMDHLYAYFSGAPLGGGLSPVYSRLRKLTNLGLLNKLGLTQMYEAGNTMAAVGMGEYFKRMPDAIQAALKDKHSPLMDEMKFFNVYQPEERLMRGDLTFEFEKQSTQHEFLRGFDRVLNKGAQLQGYTSGFNHVRRMNQHIAISATADRLARHFKEGGLVTDARLADMGFDAKSMQAFEGYVKSGVVEFENGSLKKLNFDKWKTEDREGLTRILNARTDQLVMRAIAGESSYAFHKDGIAQLFFHLKSFALLTMEKQFLRNVRMADGETAAQFVYGLGVTGALAMARNTLDGRTDRNNISDLTRTALTMNHMTGWLPMWTDPVAGLLGMDGISGYASRGDFIAPSASISYANKLAQLVALPITGLNGFSNGEISALSAFPMLGNWYGFTAVLNAFKDDKAKTPAKAEVVEKLIGETKTPKAETMPDTNELHELIKKAGWSDPEKYIQNNLDAGSSLKEIRDSLGM